MLRNIMFFARFRIIRKVRAFVCAFHVDVTPHELYLMNRKKQQTEKSKKKRERGGYEEAKT